MYVLLICFISKSEVTISILKYHLKELHPPLVIIGCDAYSTAREHIGTELTLYTSIHDTVFLNMLSFIRVKWDSN